MDVAVLKIRPDTADEAERRTERWARSRAVKLQSQLQAIDKAERRATRKPAGVQVEPEPPAPWHKVAPAWTRLRAAYGAFFKDATRKR